MNMIYKKTWKYILIKYNKFYFKIKALKDFSDVFRGDIGGRLEGYHNLSQSGNCWVYDEVVVSGKVRISENSKVYKNSCICGNAIVSGNAIVTDYAIVSDNARVSGTTIVKDNTVICGDTIIDKDIIITGKNLKIQNNDDLQKILEIYSM